MQMSITYTKGHETKKANYPKTNTIHETKETNHAKTMVRTNPNSGAYNSKAKNYFLKYPAAGIIFCGL